MDARDRSIAQQQRVDQICDRFEAAFRDGTSPEIDDFLKDGPNEDHRELLKALVGVDLELRSSAGETPLFAAYMTRFPSDRAAIREAFHGAGMSDLISEEAGQEETVSQLDAMAETLMTGGDGSSGESSAAPLPKRIGRFTVLGILGEGAFGRVYRARDPRLISNVARYTDDYTPVDRFENDEHTLALYHFDEGQGDMLIDSSGNNHHGTIHGAKWVNVDGSEIASR